MSSLADLENALGVVSQRTKLGGDLLPAAAAAVTAAPTSQFFS